MPHELVGVALHGLMSITQQLCAPGAQALRRQRGVSLPLLLSPGLHAGSPESSWDEAVLEGCLSFTLQLIG